MSFLCSMKYSKWLDFFLTKLIQACLTVFSTLFHCLTRMDSFTIPVFCSTKFFDFFSCFIFCMFFLFSSLFIQHNFTFCILINRLFVSHSSVNQCVCGVYTLGKCSYTSHIMLWFMALYKSYAKFSFFISFHFFWHESVWIVTAKSNHTWC